MRCSDLPGSPAEILLKPLRVLAIVCAALSLGGCMDQDPFGSSRRTIIGPYELEQSEGATFYLQKSGDNRSGGGLLEGTVEEIGWTNGVIAARRTALFRGDPDG